MLLDEAIFLIIQYLDEENLNGAARKVERESKAYFNMKYFELLILSGEWDVAETYLGDFTQICDNLHSAKIFFLMRKQKYFEALEKDERSTALEILMKDLKVFAVYDQALFKDIACLLTVDDIRGHKEVGGYTNTISARPSLWNEVKKDIEINPALKEKLKFPHIPPGRLKSLINGSVCGQSNVPAMQEGFMRAPSTFLTPYLHQPNIRFPYAVPRPQSVPLSQSAIRHQISEHQYIPGLSQATPIRPAMKPFFSKTFNSYTKEDLPKKVAIMFNETSNVTSMQFNPTILSTLLVGTSVGDVCIHELITCSKVAQIKFAFWNAGKLSPLLKMAIKMYPRVSVNRCVWNPTGTLFGVAFSKHVIQIYSFMYGNVKPQFEIEAHQGGVNDIEFTNIENKDCIVTAGDDHKVNVWDVRGGVQVYQFVDYDAPVYSVCVGQKDDIKFFFSTSVDGKIKATLFNSKKAAIHFNAPGGSYTRIAYLDGQSRLFSCGKSRGGGTFLVEWDEAEGLIKRFYKGFQHNSHEFVHFDTTRCRFLASGADNEIKFWDVDYSDILTTTNAGGGLPFSPYVCFSKDGSLLAVTACNNGVKVLANSDGFRILEVTEYSLNAFENNLLDGNMVTNDNGKRENRGINKSDKFVPIEITNANQCRVAKLPDQSPHKVMKLVFTNSATTIISLDSAGEMRQWRWISDETKNLTKATTDITPKLLKTQSKGIEENESVSQETPCSLAMSKIDKYILSAYRGISSLYIVRSHKLIGKYLPPPPKVTCLLFHPVDNNILIFGMEDSTVLIHHAQSDKTLKKLRGHQNRITGLAVSPLLNVLVSSGADSQLFFWNLDGWKKKDSVPLLRGGSSTNLIDTDIQFHVDLTHLLVVQEEQLIVYNASTLKVAFHHASEDPAIWCATYSCDCDLVYAACTDASVIIFDTKSLRPSIRIFPSAFMQSMDISNAKPLSVAANPQEANQFAIGMSDGSVFLIEPLKSKGKWSSGQTHNMRIPDPAAA